MQRLLRVLVVLCLAIGLHGPSRADQRGAIDGPNGNAIKGLGANLDGELGIGSTVDATTATPLPGLLDVRQVDATHVSLATYAVARKGDGTVRAWGNNATGELGDARRRIDSSRCRCRG
jgi:alpha-tubulin suppressor-like RCC1 family protein